LLLEETISKVDVKDFPELEGARVEQKIHLGELEGYGTISSKPDLALVKQKHLIDWKTSTRDKSRKLQRGISLVFINRDGTTEADVWNYTFEYSEELAVAVWTRLENLWTNLQNGVELDSLERNADCFKCAIGI